MKTSQKAETNQFQLPKWLYVLAALQLPIIALFFGLPTEFPETHILEWIFFGGVGATFSILAISLVFLTKNARVVIRDHVLSQRLFRRERSIDLRRVSQVYTQAGYIVLDEGTVPKFTVSLLFGPRDVLLREIEFGRSSTKNQGANK